MENQTVERLGDGHPINRSESDECGWLCRDGLLVEAAIAGDQGSDEGG
jgi:hypothetical protein